MTIQPTWTRMSKAMFEASSDTTTISSPLLLTVEQDWTINEFSAAQLVHPENIDRAINSKDAKAIWELLDNQHLSEDQIRRIWCECSTNKEYQEKYGDFGWAAYFISGHSLFPSDLIDILAKQTDNWSILSMILRHPSTTEESRVIASLKIGAVGD